MTETQAHDLIASLAWTADGTGCWIWNGRLNRAGQPVITVDGDTEIAARFAYRMWREQGHELQSELRPGVPLIHTCGNRLCVCPFHHEPGEPGRGSPRGKWNRSKTHCRKGHAYSGDNVRFRRCGRRRCRTCHAAQARASRRRRREEQLRLEKAQEEILEDLQRPWWERDDMF